MDDFQSLDNLNYSSIGQILNTTQRLEFTTAEVQGAVSFIKQNISKGLGTGLHPFMRDDFAEVIADGFFGIELEEAQTTVLFVKFELLPNRWTDFVVI